MGTLPALRVKTVNTLFAKGFLETSCIFVTFVTPLRCAFRRFSMMVCPTCVHPVVPVPGGCGKGNLPYGICLLAGCWLETVVINEQHVAELSSCTLSSLSAASTFCLKSHMKFCSCPQLSYQRWVCYLHLSCPGSWSTTLRSHSHCTWLRAPCGGN